MHVMLADSLVDSNSSGGLETIVGRASGLAPRRYQLLAGLETVFGWLEEQKERPCARARAGDQEGRPCSLIRFSQKRFSQIVQNVFKMLL